MLGDCFLWKGWISTLRCLRILVSSESWPIYHSFIKDEKSSWWSWFEKIPEVRFQGKVVGCIFKLPDVYNSFFGLFYRMQFAHCTSYKGKRVHQWFEHYTILHLHTLQKEASQGWLDLGNVFVCIAGARCKLNINVRLAVVFWCLCLRLAEEHQKLTQDSGCFRQDIMSLEVIDTQSCWVARVLQAEPFWV